MAFVKHVLQQSVFMSHLWLYNTYICYNDQHVDFINTDTQSQTLYPDLNQGPRIPEQTASMEMSVIHYLAAQRCIRPTGTGQITGGPGFITCSCSNWVALSMTATSVYRKIRKHDRLMDACVSVNINESCTFDVLMINWTVERSAIVFHSLVI